MKKYSVRVIEELWGSKEEFTFNIIKRYKNLEGSDFSGTRKEVNNIITILEEYKMLRLEKSRRRFQQQISDANSELPPYPRRVIEKMYIVENALDKTLKPINLF